MILAAAEAVPFAKLGGLGDVTTALAGALAEAGLQVTVILPAYGTIETGRFDLRRVADAVPVPLGRRWEACDLLRGELPGTRAQVVLVQHPGFFDRPGIYTDPETGLEYADAVERWTFFSRAILSALPVLGPAPDVLHLNDHHCALTAALRRHGPKPSMAFLRGTAVVLGIHNLGYQGIYDARLLPLTGLPETLMAPMGVLEFWGRMNYMKAGLVCADVLTTVSPTYAREIQESEEMGYGLQGVLQSRQEDLHGILNGIDTMEWNPATDPLLPARFEARDLTGKGACKTALQERSGLAQEPGVPLFGMVSRLVHQKGVDLLVQTLPRLLDLPMQVVVLGRGLPEIEARLRDAAREHPIRLAVHLGYDEHMAHWIEAGSDFFLMPSRYEPCGLNQMYSMRYGTVPVVRRTGGLADTVRDWDGRQGTGFCFETYSPEALENAIRRALEAYRVPSRMHLLRQAGMGEDFSWKRSGARYEQVYARALASVRKGTGGGLATLGH